jgi:cytochrome c biogenesis protein CcmG/thiol:disulfide interchange protein DsbE
MWPLGIFCLLAILFALALRSGDPALLPSALIGKPAPQIDLPALPGLQEGSRSLPGFGTADLRGEVSVVNFFASWCGPCLEEHPLLAELVARTGVRLYGVNFKDQAEAARRFLAHNGNPYRAVGVDGSGRAAIDWGVYGMPETFVVDGQGVVVYKHIGPLTPQALEAKMLPAIRSAAR